MNTVTVGTLRSYIERLKLINFTPDLLIVDYADIMRSSQQFDAPRFEQKKIYEELRGFAVELDIPIWSASQSNKAGANEDIVGLENMAEAYAKAGVCDLVIGLSRKPEEKATGTARLFIAKNRNGVDGITFDLHIDTSMSKFRIVDRVLAEEKKVDLSDEDEGKKFLRSRWKKLVSTQDDDLNLTKVI
jgi:replicative DNA helicase